MHEPVCELEITYSVEGLREDHPRFLKAAQWVARHCNLLHMEVSIAIVDDPAIHQLNCEYLDHDWPTDVISFVFDSDEAEGRVEGEIIASAETATRLAAQAGWDAEDELLLYIVHGLLHLAGLDDIEPEDAAKMRQAEQACLLELGVHGAAAHLDRWRDVSY
jgi:probable rRNA maturation factor